MEYIIKWVMPSDKSKLFWEITSPDNASLKEYASTMEFKVPVRADYKRLYCSGLMHIDDSDVAYFYPPVDTDPHDVDDIFDILYLEYGGEE